MVRLVPSNVLKPSSNFLIDLSKAVLLLCNLFCVCLCHTVWSVPFSLVATCWVKGWPLGNLLYEVSLCFCVCVFCHLPIWCPGSGVVPNCIDF